MKRRSFNIMGAVGVAVAGAGVGLPKSAFALTEADAATLKTTLTPFGAERAGNADGSIPAWTGENMPLPAGGGPYGLMPDYFASDAKVVSINAANMAQYQDRLSAGVMGMMQKYPNYRIDVYPTHRTGGIATQEVYDNTAANVTRVQPVAGGSRLGFTGGYGGIPFPIINQSDPYEGGAQLITNHNCRWFGAYEQRNLSLHSLIDGQKVLCTGAKTIQICPYYLPGGSPDNYNGFVRMTRYDVWGPAQNKGQGYIVYNPTNPTVQPEETWEYLTGQGRVRKAPELQFDTPNGPANDIINYDESYLWYGTLNQYDWKVLGKKEMYIPYNNGGAYLQTSDTVLKPDFPDPDYIRWELHRVWVVEATLHPGNRNTLPHRFFYVDEDTYSIAMNHAYDANGNLFKFSHILFEIRPDIPAVIYGNGIMFNIQTGQYVTDNGPWNEAPLNGPYILDPIPPENVQPTAMASQQSY